MNTEIFIYGEVIGSPILKWTNGNKVTGECTAGFEIRLQTNSLLDGGETILDVLVVYDLMNWDIMKSGQWVKLSVKREESSQTSPSGKVLKCNVVSRR